MIDLALDHVGIGIADLDRGRDAFLRLGFRLTARSMHAGSPSPGAPVVPWGSGNHCAMLGRGYIEVLGLTDPERFSSVKDMVARYQGLHIVALGCDDADAAHRALIESGLPVEAPRALERDATFGEHDEATRRARFRNIYLDRSRYPEARFLYIEHLTRDVLWQPHLLDHPNGAVALEHVYFCADDVAATAGRLRRVTTSAPTPVAPAELELRLASGSLRVMDRAAWARRQGETAVAPVATAAGFAVRVKSLAQTRGLLVQRGVPFKEHDGIWIDPADGCGATVHFLEEK
jgi:catechol 2,3-dioxygenase-like lactoylglutathione lyase family enzyme